MIKKYIDIEKCSGYWNFMYEYQMKGDWYPCHAIEQTDDGYVRVFNSVGNIFSVRVAEVRKMSLKSFLAGRKRTIDDYGSDSYRHGLHSRESEDVNQFLAAPTI